jgi:hypothetical protein
MAGFSLHAGVATRGNEREKLERVCRYIARPALSENCQIYGKLSEYWFDVTAMSRIFFELTMD